MARRIAVILVLVSVAGLATHAAFGAADASNPAIFEVLTVSKSDGGVVLYGTAFFIASDGTALTNSHVVHFAASDPAHYDIIGLFRREFYTAEVVCANALPVPPEVGKPYRPPLGRDIAEIKLRPSRWAGAKVLRFRNGPEFTAHLVGLPAFSFLRLGDDPAPGAQVRVTGYGLIQERLQLTPWEQWTTQGVVQALSTAPDGTPLFRLSAADSPRPGSSGSPVLDEAGDVVGIIAWASTERLSVSAGITSSALKDPCAP